MSKPDLKVPNAIVWGVGAIGALALYKLVTVKPEQPRELPGNSGILPVNISLLGDPLNFTKGKFYRARLELPDPQSQPIAPFNNNGTAAQLSMALVSLGFGDVSIFMNSNELPVDWPAQTVQNLTNGTRWFQGKWDSPSMQ